MDAHDFMCADCMAIVLSLLAFPVARDFETEDVRIG